jgi:hypothetical protein
MPSRSMRSSTGRTPYASIPNGPATTTSHAAGRMRKPVINHRPVRPSTTASSTPMPPSGRTSDGAR